jgi:hypothetical protein
MVETYIWLEEGARFYEALWDRVPSVEREKGYGNSYGKGIGADRIDLLLQMPPIPSSKDLGMTPNFRSRYGQKIEEASLLLKQNDQLISKLMRNITRVNHNSYNLEVFLAIAYLEKYTIETVLNLARVEDLLAAAAKSVNDPAEAVDQLMNAYELSGKIVNDQQKMWSDFQATWYKSRLIKNRSAGGKDFYYEMDDVKDHFADRRKGLDYMLAPFVRMQIPAWRQKLKDTIYDFAKCHNIPVEGSAAKRLED